MLTCVCVFERERERGEREREERERERGERERERRREREREEREREREREERDRQRERETESLITDACKYNFTFQCCDNTFLCEFGVFLAFVAVLKYLFSLLFILFPTVQRKTNFLANLYWDNNYSDSDCQGSSPHRRIQGVIHCLGETLYPK